MLVLVGCQEKTAPQTKNTMLTFMEQEKYVKPYQTRFIISDEFIRIDDGQDGLRSFILFDRKQRSIYSVSTEEKRILQIMEKNIDVQPPIELKQEIKQLDDMQQAPKVGNELPTHHELIINGKSCYQVVAVKNLLPGVVQALKEFHTVLASDSKQTINNIPADLQDPCELSMSTFTPLAHLQFGMPIQERGRANDYQRSLVDYKQDYQPAKDWYVLPQGYQQYLAEDMRMGRVQFAE